MCRSSISVKQVAEIQWFIILFKMAAVCHLGFVTVHIAMTHTEYLEVFIIVQNLVGVTASVLILWKFEYFACLACKRLFLFLMIFAVFDAWLLSQWTNCSFYHLHKTENLKYHRRQSSVMQMKSWDTNPTVQYSRTCRSVVRCDPSCPAYRALSTSDRATVLRSEYVEPLTSVSQSYINTRISSTVTARTTPTTTFTDWRPTILCTSLMFWELCACVYLDNINIWIKWSAIYTPDLVLRLTILSEENLPK